MVMSNGNYKLMYEYKVTLDLEVDIVYNNRIGNS